MHDLDHLVEGYRSFRRSHYKRQRERYEELAEKGQKPRTMVISCCDSRADPATIFDAAPGELFVVRNVANLVPPAEQLGDYHGTSAALEFAVTALEVESILVMGHGKCGGVKAFLDSRTKGLVAGDYIGKWLSILHGAYARAEPLMEGKSEEDQLETLERVAVLNSIANLKSFPFVSERLKDGRLSLHGGHFDISKGQLYACQRGSDDFTLVRED